MACSRIPEYGGGGGEAEVTDTVKGGGVWGTSSVKIVKTVVPENHLSLFLFQT